MTAPRKKRKEAGFSQLAVWIREGVMLRLQERAEAEDRAQRELVEAALIEYFERPRAADGSPKASSA